MINNDFESQVRLLRKIAYQRSRHEGEQLLDIARLLERLKALRDELVANASREDGKENDETALNLIAILGIQSSS